MTPRQELMKKREPITPDMVRLEIKDGSIIEDDDGDDDGDGDGEGLNLSNGCSYPSPGIHGLCTEIYYGVPCTSIVKRYLQGTKYCYYFEN
jgi:hypothetical protein